MASAVGDRGAARRGWALVGALVGAAALQGVACDPGSSDGDPDAVAGALQAALGAVGDDVVIPALRQLSASTEALEGAAEAWAAAPADLEARAAVQDAWRDAFAAWQVALPLAVGPAAEALGSPGAAGIGARMYTWPGQNPCRVDQEVAAARWDAPDFFQVTQANAWGLDALETLVFAPDADNACPPQVDINANGTWDALGEEGVAANRASYAHALAVKLHADAAELERAWDPAFAASLAAAGDGAPYDSQQEALQAVYEAAFYVVTVTRSLKVELPMGLRPCTGVCPSDVEAALSGASTDAVRANLAGLRALADGALLPLLRDVQATAAADTFDAALTTTVDAFAAVDGPIDLAMVDDAADLAAAQQALHALADVYATEVRVALTLQLPAEGSGDND